MSRTGHVLRAALAAVLLTLTAVASPAAAATDATFAESGYPDATVHGVSATSGFFFALPPGAAGDEPTTLDLVVSHSALLLGDLSTMTVRAGGVSLASVRLDETNVDHGHVAVDVPANLVAAPGLFVEAAFYLRSTREDCEDPTNPALWATVHEASSVAISTTGERADLGDVASALLPDDDGVLTMAIDGDAEGDLLAAAGIAAAQAGRWSAVVGRQPVIELASPSSARLVVGSADGGADEGMVAISADPLRVRLDGGSAAGTLRAASAIADPTTVALLRGAAVHVSDETPSAPPAESVPWTESAASFAQLGIDERAVSGAGQHGVQIEMVRPSGWKIERSGHLDLDIDSTPGLLPVSSVHVAVNGDDLGTKKLAADGGRHTYTFDVPHGLLDSRLDGQPIRALSLQVTLTLHSKQDRCDPIDPGAIAATILPTSAWRLPHRWAKADDIGRFPYRLSDARGTRALVVVPTSADDDMIEAGLQVCAAIGRWADAGAATPTLVRADDVTREQRESRSLVLLGDADDELGEPIDVGTVAVAQADDDVVAVVGMRTSPWDDDGRVLVIHGDGDTVSLAARSLLSPDTLAQARGSEVAFVGGGAQSLTAARDQSAPAALAPVVTRHGIRPEVVVSAIVLVLFLLMIALVIWFRWVRPRRRA